MRPMTQNDIYTDNTGRRFYLDEFVYESEILALTANGIALDVVNIDVTSDFVWVKASFEYQVTDDITSPGREEALLFIPNVLVSIQDASSGRHLQNRPVPLNNFAGRAGLPAVLPIPREFDAASSINITYINVGTVTTGLGIKLSLIGYKKFKL